ncbi:hypothetical protein NAF17_00015 [Mucilaginibacter sp. RB4R14]|uniref:hypothetical protein n=1 Tax=Mucilaginibacter aurantiaciroseus TaxID=2949308 RepID=UPI002090D90A|nr:hypothetical protein [Mucilaginibacter aurantiaciroseus]MCO5933907.1 hypothetical protein [Mucilaginibacter aurantiaciroseus]
MIDQRCSLEALHVLKLNSSKLFIRYKDHFSKKNFKRQNTHVFSEGVDVSLSPDFAIYDRVTKKIAGFIKLNFLKKTTVRLTYQQGQLIAGLIKDHLEEQFEVKFDRKLCVAIDVFTAKVIYAPEEITWEKDKPKLKVAYREIYNVWPYLNKN